MVASFSLSSLSLSAINTNMNTNPTTYKVFALRHGKTDTNSGGIIQGLSGFLRLTPLGKQQARHDDDTPQQQQQQIITSLYCSPLCQVQETLQVLQAHQSYSANGNHIGAVERHRFLRLGGT
jgi:broad specificity phosphatase PhoE